MGYLYIKTANGAWSKITQEPPLNIRSVSLFTVIITEEKAKLNAGCAVTVHIDHCFRI